MLVVKIHLDDLEVPRFWDVAVLCSNLPLAEISDRDLNPISLTLYMAPKFHWEQHLASEKLTYLWNITMFKVNHATLLGPQVACVSQQMAG